MVVVVVAVSTCGNNTYVHAIVEFFMLPALKFFFSVYFAVHTYSKPFDSLPTYKGDSVQTELFFPRILWRAQIMNEKDGVLSVCRLLMRMDFLIVSSSSQPTSLPSRMDRSQA